MPASAKAGWSFVGAGTIATELMVEAIRAIGHSPLWVVSQNKIDAANFAQDLGIPHSTTDVDRALQDPSVGFAYISARLKRRPHYISAAAGARKHILCDGPISDNSRSAKTLVTLCNQAGASLAVNQPLRASTIHQTMRRLISDGDIGTVRSIVLLRGGPYHGPLTRRARDADEGGGIYLDVSVEDIDLARFLTAAEPLEVTATSAPFDAAPSQLAYTVRLSNGCLFQAYESFSTADIESMVMVAGDRGALIAQGTMNGRASGTLLRRTDGKSELVPVREHDFQVSTVKDFVNTRSREASWLSGGSDSVTALLVVEAMMISAKRRRAVPING
ncbi:Gfo/Idh/MocA family oxidoreductase [Mesorhizobium sp. B2-4-15]|uniref:Gfo/Idh/MocA family protein n=1 Tax=Mesorhizobium sp. B2-4-15 TaxID=2589934 RepID=UPI001FEE7441|nr:Gfo/Idh/MocA family oxidoreductase [Mesorhizobium sp. B2-4-15]